MRGEQSVINLKVKQHPDNPIKESRGDKSIEKIIEVIEDEYWDEWVRKLNYATTGCVYVKHLGNFYIGFSQLKGYIRKLIESIRLKRKAIERYRKEGRVASLEKVIALEADLVLKLKAAWAQLDEQRMLFILRIIKWNKKMMEAGTPERIKLHYERFDYSFVNKA